MNFNIEYLRNRLWGSGECYRPRHLICALCKREETKCTKAKNESKINLSMKITYYTLQLRIVYAYMSQKRRGYVHVFVCHTD